MRTVKRTIAVVAHNGKTLGNGLGELRRVLARAGYDKPLWFEVASSRKAPKAVRRSIEKGATLIFVWGGDGMVQRCIDAAAGTDGVELAIIPAGTANLLARNLGIQPDITKAVRVGLHGGRTKLDVGTMNGERFAVMAGTGFDALTMRRVNGAAKERLGRLAYVQSGIKAMQASRVRLKIRVDGAVWFEGKASAMLIGNVGTVSGGLTLFPDAVPTDGVLEVGVVTANGTWQWVRVFSRIAGGHLDRSPFIHMTRGKKIRVDLDRKLPYELDGGARPPRKRLKVRIEAGAITMCVPKVAASARAPKKEKEGRARLATVPAPEPARATVQPA